MRVIFPVLVLMGGVVSAARAGSAPPAARGWVVMLSEKPVVARHPGRIEAIRAIAEPYRQHLKQVQAGMRARMEGMHVRVTGGVQHVMNAMFVVATPAQAAALRNLPGVQSVSPMRKYRKEDQLTLSNVEAAWNTSVIGGESKAGEGLKIAIIDTGIDQTHPSFQDASLAAPAGFPKCDANSQPCSSFTNNKVIVARSYVDTLVAQYMNPNDPASSSRPDDLSARDRDGHGTAVASVAAGVATTYNGTTVTGVAPKAFLGSYKIFGSSEVNPNGAGSIIQALDDAVTDGMDIINLSLGGPAYSGPLDTGAVCGMPAGAACDALAVAIQNAVESSGVVVVAAAGNEGANGYQFNYGCSSPPCFSAPTFASVGSPAYTPNALAAGGIENDVTYAVSVSVTGSGVPANLLQISATESFDGPAPGSPLTAPVIDVTMAGDSDGLLCNPISVAALANSLALVQRGTCNFSDKVTNAQNAGASGVIFIDDGNGLGGWTAGTNVQIPSFLVSQSDGANLKSYVDGHGGTQATLNPNPFQVPATALGYIPRSVAYFASRGPVVGTGALKPDVSAAATDFLLAVENYDPYGELFSLSRYGTADGTSFATPMLAGAAALVKQANPGLTPLQINSALVNTGSLSGLLTSDGTATPSISEVGSGLMQAQNAVVSTVQIVPSSISFGQLFGALPASQALTIFNSGTSSVTLSLSVAQPAGLSGTQVQLNGSTSTTVSVPAGQSTTVTASLSGGVPVAGRYEGLVTISGAPTPLTIPYMFLVGNNQPYDIIPLNGVPPGALAFDGAVNATIPWYATVSCPNPNSCALDYGSVAIQVIDQYGAAVANFPVTWSVTQGGGSILQGSQFTDSVTDQFGIAGASVVLGPNPGNQEFTATVNGMPLPFDGYARAVPVIDANGIKDAASFTVGRAVAPGSYIAVYGANLSDVTDVAYAICPLCSPAVSPFPLGLDGVAFSFDVTSAAPPISEPGRVEFVSSGQVNVLVPWELAGQTSATVKLMVNYTYSAEYTLPLATYAPGFFLNFGQPVNGQLIAAAEDGLGNILGPSTSIARGDVLQLFMNGLGPVTNQPATGYPAPGPPDFALTTTQPTITIGGVDAGTPAYSGLGPGEVGVYQVNVVVPASIGTGLQPVTCTIGGVTTTAMIPVK